jgi:hypothetical protein
MNPYLEELIQRLKALHPLSDPWETNESACLEHLLRYLTQKNESDREALLTLLQNITIEQHGLAYDRMKIATGKRCIFRSILPSQELSSIKEEAIDALYDAIVMGEIK